MQCSITFPGRWLRTGNDEREHRQKRGHDGAALQDRRQARGSVQKPAPNAPDPTQLRAAEDTIRYGCGDGGQLIRNRAEDEDADVSEAEAV